MIGVDFGSSLIKWFDGENFGEGIPRGNVFNLGLSSSEVFVKFSEYPICRGGKLRKIILNDVSLELSVDTDKVSVAFCPTERVENGCRFLIFVEKREAFNRIPEELLSHSQVTVDILGGVNAILLNYTDTFTLIDAGKGKIAVVNVSDGVIKGCEILRGGFDYYKSDLSFLRELLKGEVFLSGGGALSEEFRGALKEITNFTVPELEPFGDKTPLYLNAYGLYKFRKFPCKAYFKSASLLSSEFLQKNKRSLLFVSVSVILSLSLITASEVLNLLTAKRDYLNLKRSLNKELSKILGERVLAPEIQVPQKLESLEKISEFLEIDTPSILFYIDRISKSVVSGINVSYLEGGVSSRSFKLKGKADSDSSLGKFVENLKRSFSKVSLSTEKQGKSGISFTILLEVKGGT
jgi:hypothetical protein